RTSSAAVLAIPPADSIAWAAASSFSCFLPASTTVAPCPANRSAIRCPMPLPPPVMKAVFPSRSRSRKMLAMQGENIMGTMKTILLAAALACLFAFAAPLSSPFTAWHRAADQPVLRPEGDSWEAAGVFNPAAIHKGNEIILLYRAQDRAGVSRIGYAGSRDGLRFTRRKQPVLSPEAPYEKNGGVEDPRVVEIGGTYYLTYTGYNKKDAQLCLASSPDLIHWNRKGVILPAYKGRWNTGWTKSGAILDRKVNGKYWMYFMADAKNAPGQTGVAYSDDLIHWTEPLDHPVLPHRAGKFDSRVVEPGPPPIVTKDGILLVYNGADDNLV